MAVATDRDTGLKIRALRKAAGLTQAELAEASALEIESVNRIENAKLNASRATLQRIAEALGTSLSELEGKKPPTPASPQLSPARRRLIRLVRDLTDEQVEVLVRSLGSILRLVANVRESDRKGRARTASNAAAAPTASRRMRPSR